MTIALRQPAENSNKLVCFLGICNQDPDRFWSACFATDADQAKKMMWDDGDLYDRCDAEWDWAEASRYGAFDHLLNTDASEPYIVRDAETLRRMGWSNTEDQQCDQCQLWDMGIDEYRICPECEWCPECGHDSDCPQAAG